MLYIKSESKSNKIMVYKYVSGVTPLKRGPVDQKENANFSTPGVGFCHFSFEIQALIPAVQCSMSKAC